MTINQERTYIMNHPYYKGSVKWTDRVLRMPDPQVHAIFMKFQQVDYKKLEKELKDRDKENRNYHQINIFELEASENGE